MDRPSYMSTVMKLCVHWHISPPPPDPSTGSQPVIQLSRILIQPRIFRVISMRRQVGSLSSLMTLSATTKLCKGLTHLPNHHDPVSFLWYSVQSLLCLASTLSVHFKGDCHADLQSSSTLYLTASEVDFPVRVLISRVHGPAALVVDSQRLTMSSLGRFLSLNCH